MKKRRYGKESSAPSGGEAAHINGLGQLAPGRYRAEVTFMKNQDTYCVVCLTTPTGDYHSESLKEWPSWLREGLAVGVHIGLTPGVIIVRDAKYHALMDAQTKQLQSEWHLSIRHLRDVMTQKGLFQAIPTVMELTSGDRLFTFKKTKPNAAAAPDRADIPRHQAATPGADEPQD